VNGRAGDDFLIHGSIARFIRSKKFSINAKPGAEGKAAHCAGEEGDAVKVRKRGEGTRTLPDTAILAASNYIPARWQLALGQFGRDSKGIWRRRAREMRRQVRRRDGWDRGEIRCSGN
jgi:hypothetical protein